MNIILIGAGNLAWHLGPALNSTGNTIIQVYSRSKDSASALGKRLGVQWTDDAGELHAEAEVLLFCVPDQAISEFPCSIELKKKLMMVHTAGSVPAEVFEGITRDYGVLYPLMTFSKGRLVDISAIPFCIEGSNTHTITFLEKIAGSLSKTVYHVDSEQRKILHLAAVFASNFTNHMYHLSREILEAGGIDFEILKPLILETASKVMEMNPQEAQTGPAARNDQKILQEHMDLLKDDPELQKLYTFVSNSIFNLFQAE